MTHTFHDTEHTETPPARVRDLMTPAPLTIAPETGACTRPLRIIPLVLKPEKMPSYHNDLRGHCHGVTPVLLPTRSVGAHMALHHVASQLARAKRDPANPASPAHQAQAFPFH